MNDYNTQEESGRKGKGEGGAFSSVTDTDRAVAYFRKVLAAKDATKSEKANAASELARIDQRQGRPDITEVSRMPRALLVAEIERVRAVVSSQTTPQQGKA